MKIGYARVSTDDQTTDQQRDALTKAGATKIYEDKASGTDRNRPQLAQALSSLQPGDTLIVWHIDRLARSVMHLLTIMDDLHKRKVEFVSIMNAIDTTTVMGRAMFQITAVFAELERNMISERTKAHMQAAKARGVKFGRKSTIPENVVQRVIHLQAEGYSTREIERITEAEGHKVSRDRVSCLTKNLDSPQ